MEGRRVRGTKKDTVLFCLLVAQRPYNMPAYLRDGGETDRQTVVVVVCWLLNVPATG